MSIAQRFYYLENFKVLLSGLTQRYHDLLNDTERGFIGAFDNLPQCSQALLVRMIMRKGALFRASKLRYAEIPQIAVAAEPLLGNAWLDAAPALSIREMCQLLRKQELVDCFALSATHAQARKDELRAHLCVRYSATLPFRAWWDVAGRGAAAPCDRVYRVTVAGLCEHLRLLFFGNYRQDLSEFVLADLGIFKYECIQLGHRARAFGSRAHIDQFFALYECRRTLHEWRQAEPRNVAALHALLASLPHALSDSEWLEDRRQRLRFEVAHELERAGDTQTAVDVYASCRDPRAAQRLQRLANRAVKRRPRRAPSLIPMVDMIVAPPLPVQRVEYAVLDALNCQAGGAAPVHYVENVLVNSLFGLLCWRAVFAPVPGAFFHAFHHGPADLGTASFRERRRGIFEECLDELDRGSYRQTMLATFHAKLNVVSPFVHWAALDEGLLRLALDCIAPAHLKVWFEWILQDINNNRAGFPDLIQFFPRERRYALIEVKGPGDRLQDNQRRCLEHCLAHRLPVSVLRVQWAESSGAI